METLGFPLILLGIIWGLLMPVLKVIEMLNERRDKIVDSKSGLTLEHRWHIFFNDWLSVAVAAYLLFFAIVALFWIAPSFIEDAALRQAVTFWFRFVSGIIFLIFTAIGITTAFFDCRLMLAALRKKPSTQS